MQPPVASTKRCIPIRTSRVTSWLEAEKIAAAWMVAFGFGTATARPGGSDLGVDVRAPQLAIAQVKRMPRGRARAVRDAAAISEASYSLKTASAR